MAQTSATIDLRRLAAETREIPHSGMIAAARAAKKIITDEGVKIAGSDGVLGKKKRGLKLRARDDIRDTDTGATCRVQGTIPGWVWMNTGTQPHAIRRRKRPKSDPRTKMTVPHPGTPAKYAWRTVEKRIANVVPRIFADTVHEVFR